jgi:tRNA nucleotidyltransferase (CCA-adding enzyme)
VTNPTRSDHDGKTLHVKTYIVGGAVRDELLGRAVADRDYVVVGSTPEEMEHLGYRPVGKDFPVFLHPETHEEYALARTERKVARGYKGFTVYAAPDVTLEQDLARRDLTINAMARESAHADAPLVDPFQGERDLREGVLRHVSAAFIEDPVRILRVARFAARFGFRVADETMTLMQRMVIEGEADALVPERVWQEFSKGLMEAHPVRMFTTLAQCGLLDKLLPECGFAFEQGRPANDATRIVMNGLDYAAKQGHGIEVRFALLACALTAPVETAADSEGRRGRQAVSPELDALVARLRATNECRDAAWLMLRHGRNVMSAHEADAAARLALLEAGDAFRRPARLHTLLASAESAQFGAQNWVAQPWLPRVALQAALAAALRVDASAVAAAAQAAGADIAGALRQARRAALSAALTAALEDNGASVSNPVSGRPAGRASDPDDSVISATRSNPRP